MMKSISRRLESEARFAKLWDLLFENFTWCLMLMLKKAGFQPSKESTKMLFGALSTTTLDWRFGFFYLTFTKAPFTMNGWWQRQPWQSCGISNNLKALQNWTVFFRNLLLVERSIKYLILIFSDKKIKKIGYLITAIDLLCLISCLLCWSSRKITDNLSDLWGWFSDFF